MNKINISRKSSGSRHPEFKLILFDLDGTLVNSIPDIVASTNFTLAQLGFEPLPEDMVRSFVGDGIAMLVRRSLETRTTVNEPLLKRALDIYYQHHWDHCLDSSYLYPGVTDILEYLKQKEKLMAIISNKAERFTRKVLDGFGISGYFKLILGGDSLPVKKPHPGVIEAVLIRLQIAAENTVIVGDSPQDIQAGKSVGILTCGALYGYRPANALQNADFLIGDISELRRIIF